MGIREDDTVETRCPVRRRGPSALLRVLGVFAALAGTIAAVALALSPGLRERLVTIRRPPVPVSIDSAPPGADVFIDEEPWGRTPTHAPLALGRHDIRIVRTGYEPWRRAFDPAQTRKLDPMLQPLKLATLVVESQPDGAHVVLDGERRGATPIRLSDVGAGAHTVSVDDEPVYETETRHIQLKAGETQRLTVRLSSRLEALYRDQIRKQPGKLGNYTELVHYYLKEERTEEATAAATKALRVLDGAEASSIELRQFYAQLDLVYLGRAAGISNAAREELLDAAQALLARLAAAKPDEPEHYLPIASILGKTGRFAKVLEACDGAAKRDRAASMVHIHIADACIGRGELKPAIALLEHAAGLRPDYYQAHHRLGTAYQRAERYDDALREYEAAARLSADAPAEHRIRLETEIARVLADKGDLGGAAARYEKALALDAPAVGGVALARGLVAHYPFDKDASDASGNGHHGENHGATLVAGGKLGGTFSFDGRGAYVSIPAQATRGLTSATFAFWVKTTQSEAKPQSSYWAQATLLGVATDGFGSSDLGLMIEKGNVAYFHGLTPDRKDMSWVSAVSVSDDVWHHIAFVNAGPLVLVYVDGRLARGEAASIGAGSSRLGVVSDTSSGGSLGKEPLFIGACDMAFARAPAGNFYRGFIDDVRIWNRALRAREIAALCTKAR